MDSTSTKHDLSANGTTSMQKILFVELLFSQRFENYDKMFDLTSVLKNAAPSTTPPQTHTHTHTHFPQIVRSYL